MRIEGPPPPPPPQGISATSYQNPGAVNDNMELWALFTQMNVNFSNPSFDATTTAAYLFQDLSKQYADNPPTPGTSDYLIYYDLTTTQPQYGYNTSIADLCSPEPIPPENIVQLQAMFQNPNSNATNIVSILTNSSNTSTYYWSNTTYSYSWGGNPKEATRDNQVFTSQWNYVWNNWQGPTDTDGAEACANTLNKGMAHLEKDNTSNPSPYTDLILAMWNQPLETMPPPTPPATPTTGKSMAQVCDELTDPTTSQATKDADSITLWNMLVAPNAAVDPNDPTKKTGQSNNMNATFINYFTNPNYYEKDLTTNVS